MRSALRRLILLRGGGSAPVNPIQTNIAAWYKAGQGITSAGGLVSQRADFSGNARHYLQASEGSKPLLNADGSLRCDGIDDSMQTGTFALAQPVSRYWLGRPLTWTNSRFILDGFTVNTLVLYQDGTTPNLRIYYNATAGPVLSPALALNTWGVIAMGYSGASSHIRLNNNARVTGTVGVTGTPAGLTMGAAGGAGSLRSNADHMEEIVFSVLHDQTTEDQVVAYLIAVAAYKGLSL